MDSQVRICKIYELDKFEKLIDGIQVAACMISDAPPVVDEASVVRRADALTASQGNSCSSCGAGPFDTRALQTAHYKHHWHAHNLRRRLLGRPPLTLLQFNSKEDEGSGISDSDSDSDEIVRGEGEVSELFLAATRHCRAYFTNKNGQVLSVYRCLLHHKKEWIGGDGRGERWVDACRGLRATGGWALFMSAGGRFAGAIFRGDGGVAIKHKSFHSYVTRRGQGKAQGTRDSRGNAPRSAGASLRRYNQEQFALHVQEVLTSWKEDLDGCNLLLYRAVGPLNKSAVFGSGSPLSRHDTRLRSFPFPTRRPSFKEVQRAHAILATMEIYDTTEIFQKTLVAINNSAPERPTGRKKTSPIKLDRAKSRETTPRPMPSEDPMSSEDETPCYIQSMGPPGWTKTLSEYDSKKKKSKSKVKDSDEENIENEVSSDTVVVQMQNINLKETLQEFDDSVKRKPKKHKKSNNQGKQDQDKSKIKDNQDKSKKDKAKPAEEEKVKPKAGPVKIPDIIKKMWDSILVDGDVLLNMLDRWEGPPSLEDALNLTDPVDGNTALHKAAIAEKTNLISHLLGFGADPCLRNLQLHTPYSATTHHETRIAFRLFQGLHPDKYQYSKANIPGPLTQDIMDQEKEKKSAQRKAKRLKDKEKLQEKIKTTKFMQLNDVQKIAATSEKRCFSCGGPLDSKPFNYEDYKFCTIKCLQNHRNARPLNLSKQ